LFFQAVLLQDLVETPTQEGPVERRPHGFALILPLAALLSACASKRPHVSGDVPGAVREAARIGCLALHYSKINAASNKPPRNEARDREIAICEKVLAKAKARNRDLTVLYGDEAWAAALPGVPVKEFPDDGEGLVKAAAKVVRAEDGLRYLVAMEVRTTAEKRQDNVDGDADGSGGGGIIMLGYEHSHDRTTATKALFFDLFEGRELASMDASWNGKEGWFIGAGCCIAPPFILPFVTPPIPYATATEEETLEAIGEKIGAQFKK
jgi:hypothetical protein